MQRTVPVVIACFAFLGCARQTGGPDASDPLARTAVAAGATMSGTLNDPASGAQCAGKDVRITRNESSTVLEGRCNKVTITASNASVNVEEATSIAIEGDEVVVLNSRVDLVESSGDDARLNLTEVGRAVIAGNRTILLAHRIESVRFTGNDNTVNPDNAPATDDSGTGNKVM